MIGCLWLLSEGTWTKHLIGAGQAASTSLNGYREGTKVSSSRRSLVPIQVRLDVWTSLTLHYSFNSKKRSDDRPTTSAIIFVWWPSFLPIISGPREADNWAMNKEKAGDWESRSSVDHTWVIQKWSHWTPHWFKPNEILALHLFNRLSLKTCNYASIKRFVSSMDSCPFTFSL